MSDRNPKQKQLFEAQPLGSEARARLKESLSPRITHGGELSIRKRKTPRPFSPKAPLHLVLQSKRAKGSWGFSHRRHRAKVLQKVYAYAERFKVRVYRVHIGKSAIQLLIKPENRTALGNYLRVLAGRVAIQVTGAQKYIKRVGKFWDSLYWSKLLNWGRGFFEARNLFLQLEETSTHENLDSLELTLPSKRYRRDTGVPIS